MSTLPAKLVLAADEVEREKSYIAGGDVLLAALNDQARLAHAITDVPEMKKCFQDALAAFRTKGHASVKNARAGLVRIYKDIDTNLTELEEMQAGDAFTKDDVQDLICQPCEYNTMKYLFSSKYLLESLNYIKFILINLLIPHA